MEEIHFEKIQLYFQTLKNKSIYMIYICFNYQNGWFEFNTIYTLGGETGEPAVDQVKQTI